MRRNMGTSDRAIRLVAGLALVLLPILAGVAAGTAWLWWGMIVVGAILAATSLAGSCPAYTLLGIRTGSEG